MNITEYLLYCMAVLIMIAAPGPVILLVVSAGLKGGYRKALQTIFGTNFASLILIAISISVLKGFLDIRPDWLDVIKVIGCLYIAFLGVQILTELNDASVDKSQLSFQSKKLTGGFTQGFWVGISNPKDIIFFASFFPQFVQITPHVDMSLVILTLSWVVLDFVTLSVVYLSFNRLSHFKIYSKVLTACGVMLIGISIYGIYSTLI